MTNGEKTSEYKLTQSASHWGIILMILGVIVTSGTSVADAVSEYNSDYGQVAGMLVTIAGAMLKMLTSMGYNKGRVETKIHK